MPNPSPAAIAILRQLFVAAAVECSDLELRDKVVDLRAGLVEVGAPGLHASESDWYAELFGAIYSEIGELVDTWAEEMARRTEEFRKGR